MFHALIPLALLLGAALFAACSSSGAGGRPVDVTQSESGCTPQTINATPGEKLNLKVKNETGGIYEVEGTDGTNLEEVVIPEGRSREVGFNVPKEGGLSKIKCYTPGGASTIIEVRAGDAGGSPGSATTGPSPAATAQAGSTVAVVLREWEVSPDTTRAPAGSIKFEVTNESRDHVHELAVLQIEDDGSIGNVVGELEDIDPAAGGSIVVDLPAGRYQLACLVVPGEAGSTVDHYQQGMHADFTVD